MRIARCAHCQSAPSTTEWDLRACAERRRPRKIKLCGPCDVEINRVVLTFANVPHAEERVAKYAGRTAA